MKFFSEISMNNVLNRTLEMNKSDCKLLSLGCTCKYKSNNIRCNKIKRTDCKEYRTHRTTYCC